MPKKSQKKSTKNKWKRNKVQYPGLVKNVNTKVRQEMIDHDYIDQLNDKEKQFLSNFNEEYLGANFHHKGKKLHKSKRLKRDCYNRNNARNRDIYSISSVTGALLQEDFLLQLEANFGPETLMEIQMYLKKNNTTMEKLLEKINEEELLKKRLDRLIKTNNGTGSGHKL